MYVGVLIEAKATSYEVARGGRLILEPTTLINIFSVFFVTIVSEPRRLTQVELDVLKRVSHKHILALIGAGNREERPHRFLVLEVCNECWELMSNPVLSRTMA